MESYPQSQHQTSRGFLYNYVHIRPSQSDGEYILFLHGFPSSAYDWRHQISYFKAKGYGIIAPDMLGYGGTSKPLETKAYTGKGMTQDISEILKHENIDNVIGVGHDWGAFPLSRLANYYPNLLSKIAYLDVGYQAPGTGLIEQNVKNVNGMMQERFGYSIFGYFLFFNEQDAAEILDAHGESAQSLFHSRDEDLLKENMGAEGGMRKWLNEGRVAEDAEYLTPEDKEHTKKVFAPENGGYGPALNWYKAQVQDLNGEDENALPKECHMIHQPTLLISASNFIAAAADFPTLMKPLVPNLTVEVLDAGHWIQLEKPKETNELLEKFFKGEVGTGGK